MPSQTIGPATAGASLSGDEKVDQLLCRLSMEDFGLSVDIDMLWKGGSVSFLLIDGFMLNTI